MKAGLFCLSLGGACFIFVLPQPLLDGYNREEGCSHVGWWMHRSIGAFYQPWETDVLKVAGNNIFEGNKYSWRSWSANVLQTPDEVHAAFASLGVVGKRIVKIHAIGMAYNLRDDMVEESVYSYAKALSYEERGGVDPLEWRDGNAFIPCQAEIDEPLIIFLEDGDRFEIDFSEGSSVRMSKNAIPPDIQPGINDNNFDANRLFAACLENVLAGIEVESTDEYPEFTGAHDMTLEESGVYISKIHLPMTNGNRLSFEPYYDYGLVYLTDSYGNPLKMPVDEIKQLVVSRSAKQLLVGTD